MSCHLCDKFTYSSYCNIFVTVIHRHYESYIVKIMCSLLYFTFNKVNQNFVCLQGEHIKVTYKGFCKKKKQVVTKPKTIPKEEPGNTANS